MFTLLFILWVLYITGKVAGFALRAGWGIMKVLFSVIFLPITILGFLISGIIHLSIPILVIILILTLMKELSNRGTY